MTLSTGIYPREPRNKKKAAKNSNAATTFYYTKDIQYLLHEPLLNKFRDHKALAKKIGRALGKGEVRDAARLEKTQTPRITLDHIIKERYPTFIDALRDLDDALSMLFLFANLPSTATVPPKTIALCKRLCLEFEHYLIVSHSLRKSFLSIKGIYYQATIQGQDILWLVPYQFVQRVAGDIDFRIMGTFVEFYTTLLGFVNFRLYTSVGLIYPPKFSVASDERGAELGAFTLEGRDIASIPNQIEAPTTNGATVEDAEATTRAQALADSLNITNGGDAGASEAEPATSQDADEEADPSSNTTLDTFTATAPDSDTLPQLAPSTNEAASLFAPFTFYLSRETPRQPLEFILKSFGCRRVGWDAILGDGAYTGTESDSSITHQIVDRPPYQPVPEAASGEGETQAQTGRGRVPGRTYVQPQWVWDCANAGKLLRPDLYAPGATLPPHLSPWVKASKGTYDPTVPLDADDDTVPGKDPNVVGGVESVKAIADLNGEDEDMDDDMDEDVDEEDVDVEEDEENEEEDDEEVNGAAASTRTTADDDFGGFSSGSEEDEETAHQNELLAEASGAAPTTKATPDAALKQRKAAEKAKKEKAEEIQRAQMMLSRKKRKLLEKMLYSNAKKDEEAEKLRAKRRKLGRA